MDTLIQPYKQVAKFVNERIKEGKLPKAYKLPLLKDFDTTWVATALERISEPDIVFVPLGLTLTQWNTLLKATCNGLWHASIWTDSLFSGSGWELHVVAGTNAPTQVNVTYEEAQPITSAQVYIAQQWLRLEQGKQPVDTTTWTMATETVAPVDVAGVNWDPGDRRVSLYVWRADYRFGSFGVRAEESGSKSSTLEPSTSPLSLELGTRVTALEQKFEALQKALL